jgi:sugar O-acyltransferase (sialic acid O-acetyltransferase NeuD family)|tara:strand:+ start:645 stop:1289 length:645 start_codon:yes stop_codon:yes gene_type:complete
MKEDKVKLCIVGAGGFARETLLIAKALYDLEDVDYRQKIVFLVKDEDWSEELIMNVPQIKESDFDPEKYDAVVAIGDPVLRKKIVEKLPVHTKFTNLIHPKADVSEFVTLGKGIIIASGVIITCNVSIGKHAQLNLNSTIGHDCIIDDYFTASPSVSISGSCIIKEQVYLGTGSLLREGIFITNNSIIGMGAVVVKKIKEKGTYIGNPARKLDK